MKKLFFFSLILGLSLACVISCGGKGYGPEVIKLVNQEGTGIYVPTKSEPNSLSYLWFFNAEHAVGERYIDESEVKQGDIYALLMEQNMDVSKISYQVFAKVVPSKDGTTLEVINGLIGYAASEPQDVVPCTLKCIVTDPKGIELKVSGTITSIDKKFTKKIDNTYKYSDSPILGL